MRQDSSTALMTAGVATWSWSCYPRPEQSSSSSSTAFLTEPPARTARPIPNPEQFLSSLREVLGPELRHHAHRSMKGALQRAEIRLVAIPKIRGLIRSQPQQMSATGRLCPSLTRSVFVVTNQTLCLCVTNGFAAERIQKHGLGDQFPIFLQFAGRVDKPPMQEALVVDARRCTGRGSSRPARMHQDREAASSLPASLAGDGFPCCLFQRHLLDIPSA